MGQDAATAAPAHEDRVRTEQAGTLDLRPLPTPVDGPLRPFIKWAGGKTRMLRRLLPHVPSSFEDYYEPFLGGGAMFFAIRNRLSGEAHLADLNEDLVVAWLAVRNHEEELQRLLETYKARDSKAFYYEQRPLQPADPLERAARFIYLNQTSWNGLWRVNRWGEFNVPWGQRPFRGISSDDLLAYREALSHAQIRAKDFRDELESARKGDFVYLDPPYLPLSDTSKFFLYTEKRFREPDLRDLAECCESLTRRGVRWILSNRDTPLVRELFEHARMIGVTTRRSVAAQNRRDVEAIDSPEVIVVSPGVS